MGGLIFLLVVFSLSSCVFAKLWSPSQIPNPMNSPNACGRGNVPRSAICDPDLLLSETEKNTIEGFINQEGPNVEMAVLLIDQMSPLFAGSRIEEASENFAIEIHNTWGVGDKSKNDGVLIFLSIVDRAIFISVGSGLKTQLYDDLLDNLIDHMKPHLRSKNIARALETVVIEIDLVVSGKESKLLTFHNDPDTILTLPPKPWISQSTFESLTVFSVVSVIFMFGAYLNYQDKKKQDQLREGSKALERFMREVEEEEARLKLEADAQVNSENQENDTGDEDLDGDGGEGGANSSVPSSSLPSPPRLPFFMTQSCPICLEDFPIKPCLQSQDTDDTATSSTQSLNSTFVPFSQSISQFPATSPTSTSPISSIPTPVPAVLVPSTDLVLDSESTTPSISSLYLSSTAGPVSSSLAGSYSTSTSHHLTTSTLTHRSSAPLSSSSPPLLSPSTPTSAPSIASLYSSSCTSPTPTCPPCEINTPTDPLLPPQVNFQPTLKPPPIEQNRHPKRPMILRCGHVFCHQCLVSLLSAGSSASFLSSESLSSEQHAKCPICRLAVDGNQDHSDHRQPSSQSQPGTGNGGGGLGSGHPPPPPSGSSSASPPLFTSSLPSFGSNYGFRPGYSYSGYRFGYGPRFGYGYGYSPYWGYGSPFSYLRSSPEYRYRLQQLQQRYPQVVTDQTLRSFSSASSLTELRSTMETRRAEVSTILTNMQARAKATSSGSRGSTRSSFGGGRSSGGRGGRW